MLRTLFGTILLALFMQIGPAAEQEASSTIDFNSLPFDQAITIVKGNGTRKLATFTDPDCPFCRQLEVELKAIDNVTVYIFLLPVTKLHPDAEKHSRAIWCSHDRIEAWSSWVVDRKEPASSTCDQAPIRAINDLAHRLNIRGTPTIYFENGHRFAGSMPAVDLEKALQTNGVGGADPYAIASCKAPTSTESTAVAGSCTP